MFEKARDMAPANFGRVEVASSRHEQLWLAKGTFVRDISGQLSALERHSNFRFR
jgi:hypothetical protein